MLKDRSPLVFSICVCSLDSLIPPLKPYISSSPAAALVARGTILSWKQFQGIINHITAGYMGHRICEQPYELFKGAGGRGGGGV